ncbi:MAG: citrate synthase, partial [Calditrichaeota bacterium]|nr:citrate synthase [Calditrichota bacterium]
YTKSDPRAIVLKEKARELAKVKNREDELQMYLHIEEVTPQIFADVKGSTKVISPNVDFFSGFVYDMLGFDPAIYTPMFAMARVVGWSAHRIDELINGGRIIRPGYRSVAEAKDYISITKR